MNRIELIREGAHNHKIEENYIYDTKYQQINVLFNDIHRKIYALFTELVWSNSSFPNNQLTFILFNETLFVQKVNKFKLPYNRLYLALWEVIKLINTDIEQYSSLRDLFSNIQNNDCYTEQNKYDISLLIGDSTRYEYIEKLSQKKQYDLDVDARFIGEFAQFENKFDFIKGGKNPLIISLLSIEEIGGILLGLALGSHLFLFTSAIIDRNRDIIIMLMNNFEKVVFNYCFAGDVICICCFNLTTVFSKKFVDFLHHYDKVLSVDIINKYTPNILLIRTFILFISLYRMNENIKTIKYGIDELIDYYNTKETIYEDNTDFWIKKTNFKLDNENLDTQTEV